MQILCQYIYFFVFYFFNYSAKSFNGKTNFAWDDAFLADWFGLFLLYLNFIMAAKIELLKLIQTVLIK